MKQPAHKTDGVNCTKTIRFYSFVFTGNAPHKGKRIPLNKINYNEQRDEEPRKGNRAPQNRIKCSEETGYGYFGARYMDHELLTSFLSIDRYADKYPFISPYAYCAWNPIILTDPSGDTICHKYNDRMYYYSKTSTGHYSWMDNEGNIYMGGEDVNFDKLTDALRKLQEKPVGNKLVGDLITDDKTVEIVYSQNNGSDQINGKWVKWNPYKTTGNFLNEDGSRERPSFIGLGHELAHIYDVWHGTNDQTEWFTTPFGDVVPKCEITVGAVENQLRAEHGIPRRKFYFYHVDEKTRSIYYNGLLIENN